MIAYLLTSDGKGTNHVHWCLIWDEKVFNDHALADKREAAAKDGNTIAIITEEEYRAIKWPKAPGRSSL